MNTITIEIIERAIKHERDRLSNLERERDEIVDRIGALKEDLASAELLANARRAHQHKVTNPHGRVND